MKLYNCVMLSVSNPILSSIHHAILNDYSKYVNLDKVKECGWRSLVETDPHITIIYGLTPGVGRHTLYHDIKLKNRDEYLALRKLNKLVLNDPVIDTFNNEDAKVLKINFKGCQGYNELNNMMLKLSELPNEWQYADDYNPHLTLTYLKPDAPDSVAEELTEKFKDHLQEFIIGDFMISGDDLIPDRFK